MDSLQSIARLFHWDDANIDIDKLFSASRFQRRFQRNKMTVAHSAADALVLHLIMPSTFSVSLLWVGQSEMFTLCVFGLARFEGEYPKKTMEDGGLGHRTMLR